MTAGEMDVGRTQSIAGGILERRFTVPGAIGLVPGVLWTSAGGSRPSPLVLLGHGGSGSKESPNIAQARDYFTGLHGLATVAIDGPAHGERGSVTSVEDPAFYQMWERPGIFDEMVQDWRATLNALLALGEFNAGAVGYYGFSMGTLFGIPLLADEPRIRVAVLGLCGLRGKSAVRSRSAGRLAADAPRITCPLMYHVQWDDERFDRDGAFELYSLLGSSDKRMQSTPGLHVGGISAEARSTLFDFLAGRLTIP